MTWTNGETIIAARLEDKNDLGATSGFVGLDTLKSIICHRYKYFRGGFGDNYTVVQGTWAFSSDASQTDYDTILCSSAGYVENSSGAKDDEIKWSNITLNAGNYKFILVVRTRTSGLGANLELLHGTTSIGTHDNGIGDAYNHIITFTYNPTIKSTADLRLRVVDVELTAAYLDISRLEMFKTG